MMLDTPKWMSVLMTIMGAFMSKKMKQRMMALKKPDCWAAPAAQGQPHPARTTSPSGSKGAGRLGWILTPPISLKNRPGGVCTRSQLSKSIEKQKGAIPEPNPGFSYRRMGLSSVISFVG